MAQKASLYRLLLHRYGSHFCTDMRYITYSMSHEQISALPRWYGRTVTVREVAGASSRETRSRTRTRTRTRTELQSVAGARPAGGRAPRETSRTVADTGDARTPQPVKSTARAHGPSPPERVSPCRRCRCARTAPSATTPLTPVQGSALTAHASRAASLIL